MADEYKPNFPNKPSVQMTVLTAGSIIYYLFRDYLKTRIPTKPNNQVFLNNDQKTKPGRPLKAEDEAQFPIPKPKKVEEVEWIEGLFPKETLTAIFEDKTLQPQVDKLRALVEYWATKMMELVDANAPKKPDKKAGAGPPGGPAPPSARP